MMKKFLLPLLVATLLTTVAFAAEDTVVYGDTTYVYGGQAVETTDDNENGYLDGLVLRGVEQATYYSAGEGFLYFTPATENTPATIILDNATMIADYCLHAVTDVDLILVGENLLQATGEGWFCINVLEAYDENLELMAYEDCDFGALSIAGEGSLQVIAAGEVAFNVGQFALHSGDVSITLEDSAIIAIKADSVHETNELAGFWMDGGALDIDMGQYAGWGMEITAGDVVISGGALTIRGGASGCVGVLASVYDKDVAISITGGTTVIDTNGEVSLSAIKFDADVFVNTVIDFTDAPDGMFVLKQAFQFCDVLEVNAHTGTVQIPIFDGIAVESATQLSVAGVADYLYSTNTFSEHYVTEEILIGFTATMVGQPEITSLIRNGLVFPYTTDSNPAVEFTFTRAQIIALLWDSMGRPQAMVDNPFTDVSVEDAYYDAILWAVEQGITAGSTVTTFEPDALCTKGQLLTFLYRNAGQPEVDVENIFADVDADSYLYDAVLWGIVNTMMDVAVDTFNADSTVLNDGAVAYLICMYQ